MTRALLFCIMILVFVVGCSDDLLVIAHPNYAIALWFITPQETTALQAYISRFQ
ncbi:MAG: hypothetical protein WDO15_09610 [Bacteroidota bacterium]